MSLRKKIGFCKDIVVLGAFEMVRTKGHLIGYGAEIAGIVSLMNAHDDPKMYYIGPALYVAGRVCNNFRQGLIAEDRRMADDNYLLKIISEIKKSR